MASTQVFLCLGLVLLCGKAQDVPVLHIHGFPVLETLECKDFVVEETAITMDYVNQSRSSGLAWSGSHLIYTETAIPTNLSLSPPCIHNGSTEYDIIVMDADQTGYIPIPPTAVFETVKSSRSVLKLGDKLYFSYGEDFRIVLVAWPGFLNTQTYVGIRKGEHFVFENIERPLYMDLTSAFLVSTDIDTLNVNVYMGSTCNLAPDENKRQRVAFQSNVASVSGLMSVFTLQSKNCRSISIAVQIGDFPLTNVKLVLAYRDAEELVSLYEEADLSIADSTFAEFIAANTSISGVSFAAESEQVVWLDPSAAYTIIGHTTDRSEFSAFSPAAFNLTSKFQRGLLEARCAPFTSRYFFVLLQGSATGECDTVTEFTENSTLSSESIVDVCFDDRGHNSWQLVPALFNRGVGNSNPVQIGFNFRSSVAQVSKVILADPTTALKTVRSNYSELVECSNIKSPLSCSAYHSCVYNPVFDNCMDSRSSVQFSCLDQLDTTCSSSTLCSWDPLASFCIPKLDSCFEIQNSVICSNSSLKKDLIWFGQAMFVTTTLTFNESRLFAIFKADQSKPTSFLIQNGNEFRGFSYLAKSNRIFQLLSLMGTKYVTVTIGSLVPGRQVFTQVKAFEAGTFYRVSAALMLLRSGLPLSGLDLGLAITSNTLYLQNLQATDSILLRKNSEDWMFLGSYQVIAGTALEPRSNFSVMVVPFYQSKALYVWSQYANVVPGATLSFSTSSVGILSAYVERSGQDLSTVNVYLYSDVIFDQLRVLAPDAIDSTFVRTETFSSTLLRHHIVLSAVSLEPVELSFGYLDAMYNTTIPTTGSGSNPFDLVELVIESVEPHSLTITTSCSQGSETILEEENWVLHAILGVSNHTVRVLQRSGILDCEETFQLVNLQADTVYRIELWRIREHKQGCSEVLEDWDPVLLPRLIKPCFKDIDDAGFFHSHEILATAEFRTKGTYPMEYFGNSPQIVTSSITNTTTVLRFDMQDNVQPTQQVAVYATLISQDGETMRGKRFRQVTNLTKIEHLRYEAKVGGLDPNSAYQFHVSMVNEFGEGLNSPKTEQTATTAEGLPSAPLITSIRPGATSLRYIWQKPNYQRGMLTSYNIYYRRSSTEPWKSKSVSHELNSFDLTGLSSGQTYQIAVAATTSAGEGEWSEIREQKLGESDTLVASSPVSDGALAGISVAVVVIIVILMAFFLIRGRRHRDYNDQLEMQLQTMKMGVEELTTKVRDMFSKEFAETIGDNVEETELEFTRLELDRTQLHMGRELGKGAFGVVRMATMRQSDGHDRTVAVKTLLEGVVQAELTKFLVEARLMSLLKHESLLELLAVCTVDTPFYIVTEFMPKGDLKQYLRDSRPGKPDKKDELTQDHLMSMAVQIGAAMKYLEAKKVIHRDLAARNVLVSDDNVVKLADFGMSRNIVEADYYKKQSDDRVPVKWMAPESVNDRVYTNYSDVWSFGVLCWEIFTYAKAPYAEYTAMEAVAAIAAGYRLPHPEECSDNMYSLMLRCWMYVPTDRPNFAEINQELHHLVQTGELITPLSETATFDMLSGLGHEVEVDEDGYVEDNPSDDAVVPPRPPKPALESDVAPSRPPKTNTQRARVVPHAHPGMERKQLPQATSNAHNYLHIVNSGQAYQAWGLPVAPPYAPGPRPAPTSGYQRLPQMTSHALSYALRPPLRPNFHPQPQWPAFEQPYSEPPN